MEKVRGKRRSTSAPDVSLDDFLPYLINRITNRMNSDLHEELRHMRITVPRWRVLAVLQDRDGLSIGELAVYTVMQQPTLSRVIDQMVRLGLVRRKASTADSRVKQVFITKRGMAEYVKIAPSAVAHHHKAIAGFSERDRKTLLTLLHRVMENIRRSPFK